MGLSFLSPWVLAGLASLAIPVVIHLMLRRKPKPLLFPAFRFLQNRRKTNLRKLQLRHLLLLSLRLLLLAALALALARPLLSGGPAELAGNPDLAVVLIFDTSVSMNYVQDGKSRLDLAKEMGQTIINQLPLGSSIAVVDSGEPGSQFVSPRDAGRLVQNRRVLAKNRPITGAIEDAWRLLEKGAPKLPLLVCIFSDRTMASWDAESASLLTKLPDLEARLNKKVKVTYFDLGVSQPRNLSVTGLGLRGGSSAATPLESILLGASPKGTNQIQATLEAAGVSVNNELLLYQDGRVFDQQAVQIAAEPGQQARRAITFKSMPLPSTTHGGEVKLRSNDALEDDNIRYWTLQVSRRKVLVIADDPNDALDWRIALEALEDKLPIECKVVRTAECPAKLLPEDYQAVCLFNVARPTPALWETLTQYVNLGGGLVLLPGTTADPTSWNSAPALSVTPARLKAPRAAAGQGTFMAPNYDHPMMRRFKDWQQPITPAMIYRFWEVEPLPNQSMVVAAYADKDRPALVERLFDRKQVRGRSLIFTTPMYRRTDREWKDWNNFLEESGGAGWIALALPYLSVEYVLGARGESTNWILGEEIRFLLPSVRKFKEYKLTGPQTGVGKIPDQAATVSLPEINRPGNYEVSDPEGKVWSMSFSVNLPPRETQLLQNRPTVETLTETLGPESYKAWSEDLDLAKLVRQKFGQASEVDLLPWLLLLCLIGLAAENLLANRFYREETEGEA